MAKNKNKIIKLILKAIEANKIAHEGNKKYYKTKYIYINQAIRLINITPHCGVIYKIQKGGDQHGAPSIIYYFEWKEPLKNNKRVQYSFHQPLKKADKTKNMGSIHIKWEPKLDGSKLNFRKKLLKFYLNTGNNSCDVKLNKKEKNFLFKFNQKLKINKFHIIYLYKINDKDLFIICGGPKKTDLVYHIKLNGGFKCIQKCVPTWVNIKLECVETPNLRVKSLTKEVKTLKYEKVLTSLKK